MHFREPWLLIQNMTMAQTIYEDLSNQLDTAATLMTSPAAVAQRNTDVMFDGDPRLRVLTIRKPMRCGFSSPIP